MINLAPFLTYVFVTTFTPGPNNILSMTNGMALGYRKTLIFLAGVETGFFLVMLACGLLNVVLLSFLPQVRLWLNLLGAGYMLYLAVHIAFSKVDVENSSRPSLSSFKAGFTLQFLNLKGILYGITVYSLFIVRSYSSAFWVGLFALILSGIAFIAVSCWALGGHVLGSLLNRYQRWFNYLMGALLVYTAIASLLHS